MKGADLPQDMDFSVNFLKDLRRACRAYQSGTSAESATPSDDASQSDANMHHDTTDLYSKAEPSMRSSQQHGTNGQPFEELSSASQVPLHVAAFRAQNTPGRSTPPITEERNGDGNEGLQETPSARPQMGVATERIS
jgi:hypothetical protein